MCHGDTERKRKMLLYTRSYFYNHDDKIYTRKLYNLSMYNEIGIPSLSCKKTNEIMKTAGGLLREDESILVAERNYESSFTFAILDRNSSEVLQKLLDSIVAAMAENISVYYVDDFYKANGLPELR